MSTICNVRRLRRKRACNKDCQLLQPFDNAYLAQPLKLTVSQYTVFGSLAPEPPIRAAHGKLVCFSKLVVYLLQILQCVIHVLLSTNSDRNRSDVRRANRQRYSSPGSNGSPSVLHRPPQQIQGWKISSYNLTWHVKTIKENAAC